MHYIPYQQFNIFSKLSSSQIEERLRSETKNSDRLFSLNRPSATFEGKVTGSGFNISYQIWGRNSFNPVMVGQFTPNKDGTKIHVTMRIHLGILYFMGGIYLLSIASIIASEPLYLAMVFTLMMYLLATAGFYWQYKEIVDALLKIVEGTIK